jgi:CheY-like chemotaxis protein
MSQEQKPVTTILLIEADTSLRRLIALGLQHRGLRVIETGSPANLPDCDGQQVDLLVLDIDSGTKRNWSFLEMARLHPDLSTLPIVVLAWEGELIPASHPQAPAATATTEQVVCLAKPFDARILHETINRLLAARAAQEAARRARAEAILLASYAEQSAPSIWPVVTAAGLLLAVVGLMLQIALVIPGILIVIVALLLWTLDTKPRARLQPDEQPMLTRA